MTSATIEAMEHITVSYEVDCPDAPKTIQVGEAVERCAVIHTAYHCSCGLAENHLAEAQSGTLS